MTEPTAGVMEDNLAALKERKRLLDDVWLLALFVVFLSVGVPWYLRLLDVPFATVAWSLFGFGSAYTVISLGADKLRSSGSLATTIAMLQGLGILFIGFVWHLTGSLQNPLFLLAFVLPVVAGSLVLANWQSYATVLLSLATVFTVALMDAPELRWYVSQLGPGSRWLVNLLPEALGTKALPFPSLNTPPSYLFVLLLLFSVLLISVLLMTEALTSLLRRVYGRLEAAASALSAAENLSSEILQASPLPAALIHPDTFKIAHASQSFLHHLLLTADSMLSRDLFGLVQFSYPEVIQQLISGSGGEVPLAVYRVDGEARIARVRVDPIRHGATQYAYLTIQDISDMQCLQAALNAVGDALMVISASQHVLYFNETAQDLFGNLKPGEEASIPLSRANLPAGWWQLGMRRRQERLLEVGGRRWVATCVAAPILGEKEPLTVLNIQPAGAAR